MPSWHEGTGRSAAEHGRGEAGREGVSVLCGMCETLLGRGEHSASRRGEAQPVRRAGSCLDLSATTHSASATATTAEPDSPSGGRGTSACPQPCWAAAAASPTTPSPALLPSHGLRSTPCPGSRAATCAPAAVASTSLPYGAVCRAWGRLAQERDQRHREQLCVRGLEAPLLLLKGSRQKQHSCTHFPYLLP